MPFIFYLMLFSSLLPFAFRLLPLSLFFTATITTTITHIQAKFDKKLLLSYDVSCQPQCGILR